MGTNNINSALQYQIMNSVLNIISSENSSDDSSDSSSISSDSKSGAFESMLQSLISAAESTNSTSSSSNSSILSLINSIEGSNSSSSLFDSLNNSGDSSSSSLLALLNSTNNSSNSGISDLLSNGSLSGSNLLNSTGAYSTNSTASNAAIEKAVETASKKYGVDKNLILSVIKQESSFNPNSTSSVGAMGLMQLMPGTASELGVTNAYDVNQNVDGGTKYLKGLLNTFGNYKTAVAAYNAGAGAVQKVSGDLNKLSSETKDYVAKVTKYYSNGI